MNRLLTALLFVLLSTSTIKAQDSTGATMYIIGSEKTTKPQKHNGLLKFIGQAALKTADAYLQSKINGTATSNTNPSRTNNSNSAFTPVTNGFTEVKDGFTPVQNAFTPVTNGFTEVKKGFTPVQNAFTPVTNGFSEVKNGFTPVQNSFTPITNGFTEVKDGFTPVQNAFKSTTNAFTEVKDGFTPVQNAFTPVTNGFTEVKNAFVPAKSDFIAVDNAFIPVKDDFIPVELSKPVNLSKSGKAASVHAQVSKPVELSKTITLSKPGYSSFSISNLFGIKKAEASEGNLADVNKSNTWYNQAKSNSSLFEHKTVQKLSTIKSNWDYSLGFWDNTKNILKTGSVNAYNSAKKAFKDPTTYKVAFGLAAIMADAYPIVESVAGENIALGVREYLSDFSKTVKGSTYEIWGKDDFVGSFFDKIWDPTTKIHFNLDGISNARAAAAEGARGFKASPHATSWELYQISSNPSVLERTTFYRAGKVVPNPFP